MSNCIYINIYIYLFIINYNLYIIVIFYFINGPLIKLLPLSLKSGLLGGDETVQRGDGSHKLNNIVIKLKHKYLRAKITLFDHRTHSTSRYKIEFSIKKNNDQRACVEVINVVVRNELR